MNKAQQASVELRAMDELAAQDSPMHRLSPLSKLFVTVLYIVVTVSFHKYDISGVFVMVLFPLVGYQVSLIPVHTCFHKLRVVMPLVCAVGLFNPFFDKQIVLYLGAVGVSGGVISMLTLMMKGIFCLMASFLLAATTSIEDICRALRQLHVPKVLTSLLLLTFRYISVLLDEAAIMTDAYRLRAPGRMACISPPGAPSWGSCCCAAWTARPRSMRAWSCAAITESSITRRVGRRAGPRGPFAIGCAALIVLARLYNLPALLGGLFA